MVAKCCKMPCKFGILSYYVQNFAPHLATKLCNFTNCKTLFNCSDGFRSSCPDQHLVYSWNHSFSGESVIKVHGQPLGILYILVIFSRFYDEMQYIFFEKNFIFMAFLAVNITLPGVTSKKVLQISFHLFSLQKCLISHHFW